MNRKKGFCFGTALFALAAMLVFMPLHGVMAGESGKHDQSVGEGSDVDMSQTIKEEVAEGARDLRRGTERAVEATVEGAKTVAEEVSEETSELVTDVEQVLERTADSLNKAFARQRRIPKAVIENAAGIAVFPDITKAGLVVGGRFGNGVLMLHQNGGWNGPVFLSLYGASVGAQLGVEMTDLFMVFRNRDALDNLEDGELKLGAETSVAAGGRGAKAGTNSDADILVYKQTEGLFAGASLSGALIKINEEANSAYFENGSADGAYHGTKEALSGDKKIPRSDNAEKVIIILEKWE